MSTPPLSRDAQRPNATDFVVVGLLVVFGALNLFLTMDGPDLLGFDVRLVGWANYVAFVLLVAPVAYRRMAPTAIGLWIGIGFGVFRVLGVPEGLSSSIALFIAIHAAGAYIPDPNRRNIVRGLALASGAVALLVALAPEIDAVSFDLVIGVALNLGLNIAFYVAAWLLGDASRRQRADAEELRRRAELLEIERGKQAQKAVVEERVRIARELHDVVAHHVSVMGIQAAAARRVMEAAPDQAAEAMGNVEAAGRRAINELHRLVGFLRSEDDNGGVALPQPTLDGLGSLIETTTAAGLAVELIRIGRPRPMPESLQLSAYRIIQEALTNVMRHAPGASTTVVLSSLPMTLQVEVVNGPPVAVDNGPKQPAKGSGGGRGLVGMRERVSLLGGDVETGVTSSGGYRVRASFPWSAEEQPLIQGGVAAS